MQALGLTGNQCSQCLEIVNGSSMDVFEIDGATNRGIDEVRQIIENVRYQPAKSRFKIYIIDEVHQVTNAAFNALLKTLEEPASFVKFILATTEPYRLPETIRSRCQRFDFRRIPVHDIAGRLREIAVVESLRITEGALLLIAREAQGSMRDAQSLLEQVLSYAGPTEGTKGSTIEVDERLLQDILGIAERKTLHGLCAAVLDGKPGRCVELVARNLFSFITKTTNCLQTSPLSCAAESSDGGDSVRLTTCVVLGSWRISSLGGDASISPPAEILRSRFSSRSRASVIAMDFGSVASLTKVVSRAKRG